MNRLLQIPDKPRKEIKARASKNTSPQAQLQLCHQTALKKGGVCLSDTYESARSQMRWRCAQGHEWEGTFNNIVSNDRWCPWCAGNKVSANEQIQRAVCAARAHGGELLSLAYKGNKAPMRWRCAAGHEWEASFGTVVGRGAWCGRCKGTQRDNAEQLSKAHIAAAAKNGKCLDSSYSSNKTPMKWQCERGHVWEAAFSSIVNARTWCPICSAGLKERLVRHTLEQLFGLPFKKYRPGWLRNSQTGRVMELDGFNRELSLAFEYQCEQNLRAVLPFKMDQSRFNQGQERDDQKRTLCKAHNIFLIEVPYTVKTLDLPRWLYETIESRQDTKHLVAGMKAWGGVGPVEWTESESFSIESLKSFAQEKGGICLSPAYLGAREKHHWQCSQSHEWKATWDSINNKGSWCPVCCGNVVLNPLAKLHDAARERGGLLLSRTYSGMHKKHKWRCAIGHEWEAVPSHILGSKSWCPYCAGRKIETPLQQLTDIARGRGGECLSPDYVSSKSKLQWKCAEGHEWEATPGSIKMGRWCPICAISIRIETRRKK